MNDQMTRAGILAILALFVLKPAPALAWSCPHGEFRRVSLNRCVGNASALAQEYRGHRHVVLRITPPKAPPVIRASFPPEPPIVLPTLPYEWSE